MNDEPNRGNAPDVRHPPRGEGKYSGQHCMGCDTWKSPLGFRGPGAVKRRCADCLKAAAQRVATA